MAKATLTVTAINVSRNYGVANPAFKASYSVFVNSESLTTSGVTGGPNLTSAATVSSAPNTHTIIGAPGRLSH